MTQDREALLIPNKTGQRRLLALDGGGIRGAITLGILARLERDLARLTKSKPETFRLNHYFDFIGGTSTGAIIAAGLARGMSAKALTEFYQEAGPLMFEKEILIKRLWNKYKSDPLEDLLKKVLGSSTTLGSEDLQSLLMIVTRNATTDSPWPITNNPKAKYNDTDRNDCNLHLPLWQLVRASTAAPVYFPPEVVSIGAQDFVFVDGGTTPYNNPAFQMYRTATAPPYKLSWEIGEDRMMLVSIGTGSAPELGQRAFSPDRSIVAVAKAIAPELMSSMAFDQDINCRTIGRCVFGASLDREVGDFIPSEPLGHDLGRHFLYARYDPELTPNALDDLGLGQIEAEKVRELDSIEALDDLFAIGRAYAEKYVDFEAHFGVKFI